MLCVVSVKMLCIGRLFCEYVVRKQLVEGVDYTCRHYSLLLGFLQADVMRPIVTTSNVEMTNNPLHNHIRSSDCKQEEKEVTIDPQVSYTDLYNTSDELITPSSEQVTNDIGDDEKERPIKEARLSYSTLYEIPADEMIMQVMQKQFISSEILGSTRMALQHVSDSPIDDNEKQIEASNYDESMTASEGIAINKKKFKQGTRQSFINTFHKFQEKEALMGDNSLSLKNTLMLHSKSVKGNALLNSNVRARADPSAILMTEDTASRTPTSEEGHTASLKHTMLLYSNSVKGNALL